MCKMNLEHLSMPDSKDVIKYCQGNDNRFWATNLERLYWPKMRQINLVGQDLQD